MNSMKSKVAVNMIVAFLLVLFSGLYLVPAASAQTVTLASSLDNNTPISPGDTIEAGFQVTTGSPYSGGRTVSLNSAIGQISISCPDGKSQTIPISFSSQSLSVPAKNSGWFPSDNNTYQGKAIAPYNLCGGKQGHYSGTVFTATYGQKCDGDGDKDDRCCRPVCFRYHFACSHRGALSGGSWDNDDVSCKQEQKCISPSSKDECGCSDKH